MVSEPWESQLLLLLLRIPSTTLRQSRISKYGNAHTGVRRLPAGHPSNSLHRSLQTRITRGRVTYLIKSLVWDVTKNFDIHDSSTAIMVIFAFILVSSTQCVNNEQVSTLNKCKMDVVSVIPHLNVLKMLGCLAQRLS